MRGKPPEISTPSSETTYATASMCLRYKGETDLGISLMITGMFLYFPDHTLPEGRFPTTWILTSSDKSRSADSVNEKKKLNTGGDGLGCISIFLEPFVREGFFGGVIVVVGAFIVGKEFVLLEKIFEGFDEG